MWKLCGRHKQVEPRSNKCGAANAMHVVNYDGIDVWGLIPDCGPDTSHSEETIRPALFSGSLPVPGAYAV